MQELLDWLEYIEDDRQQRKVRHTLKDILVIVLFATLANADDWVEMALFAESYQDYLRKYIELKNGIPSHDTIRRVMGMISPEIIQQLYGKWQDRLNQNEGELLKKIICIDGKTMRSNKRGDGKASHIVSAWSKESGFCLGQKAVEEKSNEIVAIPELLDKIQIKGQIVTIDAMGTQTAIAEKIKKKRADYVLALKRNQNSLYEDVQEYFSDEEFQKEIRERGNYKKTQEKAHGSGLTSLEISYRAIFLYFIIGYRLSLILYTVTVWFSLSVWILTGPYPMNFMRICPCCPIPFHCSRDISLISMRYPQSTRESGRIPL